MRCCALVVAGGRGHRFGPGVLKQYAPLVGRMVVLWTLERLDACAAVDDLVLVATSEHVAALEREARAAGLTKLRVVVAGGAERADSVRAGLEVLPDGTELVAIHDGVRPLVSEALVREVIRAAEKSGAAICALPVSETLKAASGEQVVRTVDRRSLWLAQTPQVFAVELIRRAYAGAGPEAAGATDDAQLIERLGHPVQIVAGEASNLKITRPADLALAERLLHPLQATAPRIGFGYDVHRLVPDRPLILGGVTLDHPLGLQGHSDADVLCHAVGDALLGAAALGDLGTHFSPDDPRWEGASSLQLLAHIAGLIAVARLAVGNIDAVVVCQEPRLAPHIPAMRCAVAGALGVDGGCVAVKATTTEGLGFAGQGAGVAAYATALLLPGPGINR